MSEINQEELKQDLKKLEIALIGMPVKGSLVYLPYGCLIREKLYKIGIKLLKQRGFKQIILSDYIDDESIKKMDSVTKISSNYFKVDGVGFCQLDGEYVDLDSQSNYISFKKDAINFLSPKKIN